MTPCPKDKTWRSEAYLKFIRSKPCLACGAGAQAHHEPLGNSGMAMKAPDSHAVPLCATCHNDRHHMGFIRFWGDRNICPEMEIIRLLTEYLAKR